MIFKKEGYTFTLDEVLHHLSKGKVHLKQWIVDKFAEMENQIQFEKARADKAEALLKSKE